MATGCFKAGEAADNRTNGGAVDVSDFAEIEDDEVFPALNKGFGFLLETTAIRTALNAAFHLKEGDTVFGVRFYDVENHDFGLPFLEKRTEYDFRPTRLPRLRREIDESGVCNRLGH
jgi:hypothetical protein